MSGGSYDYLFAAGGDDLVGRDHDLERMADRLAGLGYAEDAARETVELLQRCRQFATYAEVCALLSLVIVLLVEIGQELRRIRRLLAGGRR